LLGPLFDLAKAEDITGIARGIAFQLIEALGVLERARIAAEMKDLDQPSRASLRKYGVRFGAYHIYVPPLLKPAARALGRCCGRKSRTPSICPRCQGAASCRQRPDLVPVDKLLDRDAYRVSAISSAASARYGSTSWSVWPISFVRPGLARDLVRRQAGGRI